MEAFGDRLKRLMKTAGLTGGNMAYLLSVSAQRMENLLTGYSEADIGIITRVAEIFNVSCAYASGLDDEPQVAEDGAKEIFVAERLDPVSGLMMLKDVIKTVYIDRSRLHGREYMGLVVKDDAMVKARINKGDLVIVRRQGFANNNDVVVVLADNGEYIIRRYNRTGNIVVLTSEGDGIKFPPIKIDTSEVKLNLIGRVDENRISFCENL